MQKKVIKTKLVNREEVFMILALGEALQMPVLLEGPPGTGKSNSLYDYAEDHKEDVFLVELDSGSKASEVKGFLNMKALLEEKRYETFSPITTKKYILINEVEKGSSEIRNTLLSIMQERQLQLGSEGVKECKWEVFAGSCNSIPSDERKEPFWDRFLIKHMVAPLTLEEMKYARKRITQTIEIEIPKEDEMKPISEAMMNKFDELTASALSDRARMAAPRLAAGIKAIWRLDDYQSLCKTASFLCPELVSNVSSSLIPAEIVEIKTLIHNIDSQADYDSRVKMFSKLSALFVAYNRSRTKDKEMVDMIKPDINRIADMMEKQLAEAEAKKKEAKSQQVPESADQPTTAA